MCAYICTFLLRVNMYALNFFSEIKIRCNFFDLKCSFIYAHAKIYSFVVAAVPFSPNCLFLRKIKRNDHCLLSNTKTSYFGLNKMKYRHFIRKKAYS